MKAKQSKAKNALKKIENEKESSEELKEKVKGERGFSKSKSKEPEHKNKHEGKDNQTKAHTSRPFFSLKRYLTGEGRIQQKRD